MNRKESSLVQTQLHLLSLCPDTKDGFYHACYCSSSS